MTALTGRLVSRRLPRWSLDLNLSPLVEHLASHPEVAALAPGQSVAFAMAGYAPVLRFWTAKNLLAQFPRAVVEGMLADPDFLGLLITRPPSPSNLSKETHLEHPV